MTDSLLTDCDLIHLSTSCGQKFCAVGRFMRKQQNLREIARVALRTINRIELEAGISQLEEAFEISLETPVRGLEQSGFLHRWSLLGEHDCRANIALATRPPIQAKLTIIFDIDVFKTVDLDLEIDSLVRSFGQLRELKNAIFFGSVSKVQLKKYQ